MKQQGMFPELTTYNALASPREKSKQAEQALDMFWAMQQLEALHCISSSYAGYSQILHFYLSDASLY